MQAARKITRAEWAREHRECFSCGDGYQLECHEIVRGVHRSAGVQLSAAWLRVCRECHRTVEGWPVAKQLALKKWCDPEFYDRVAVNLGRGRQPDAITEAEVDEHLPDVGGL